MSIRQLLLAVVLALVPLATARAADVSGTWVAEFETQVGVQKYVFTFKADGEKLTGTADAERMGAKQPQVPIGDGVVKGDQIAFTETLTFDGNQVLLSYKGVLAGDEIKFTREVGTFATETFVARRKKD